LISDVHLTNDCDHVSMAKQRRPDANNLSYNMDDFVLDSSPGTPSGGTQPKPPGNAAEVDPSTAEGPTGSTEAKLTEPPPADIQPKSGSGTAEAPTGNKQPKPRPGTPPKSAGARPRRAGPQPESTAARLKPTETRPKRKGVSLRIPANIMQEINAARKARPVPLDQNTWILEAIHEKATRDLHKKQKAR